MSANLPSGFSVTPFANEGYERVPGWQRRVPDLAAPLLWIVAATLAVLASFSTLNELRLALPLSSGAVTPITFRYDAWGRMTTTAPSNFRLGITDVSGANFGVLFCACAGVLFAAAVAATSTRNRDRSRLFSPIAGLAGAAALAGVTACVVVLMLSQQRSANATGTIFRFGPACYLATAASVVGLCASVLSVVTARPRAPSPEAENTLPPAPAWSDDRADEKQL